ncbi:glutamate racemase [Psychroflexus sp. MBR-150]|jgi:glutamate racemase
MSNLNSPIGIFDSGLGGLSILSEIHKQLPNEKLIYFADSANAPYGEKTEQEIVNLSIKNTQFLINNSCKIIVIACNTATTNAIHVLREKFDIPFVGIEPAIKPAAFQSLSKKIGVLATKGTLSSKLFYKNASLLKQETEIIEVVGRGIVEAIENNCTNTKDFNNLLKKQLEIFIKNEIDYLVLGCSHYSFITKNIEKIMGENVKIIDSGFAVAKQTNKILDLTNLRKKTNHNLKIDIYTNKTSIDALKNVLHYLNLNINDINVY